MSDMIISADDHIDLAYLPRDLWVERLPRALREAAPRVEDRGEAGEIWVCEGETWGDWRGGRYFARKNRSILALDRGGVARCNELRPTTPSLRLEDMDRDGVAASVMFPPIFGGRVRDRALSQAVVAGYNDWVVDFEKTAPGRFVGVAQMFPDDAEASTRELLRVAKLGMKQVNFLVGTVNPAMYQKSWAPFWAAAEDTGVIVSYHLGGSGGFPRAPRPEPGPQDTPPAFIMGFAEGATVFYDPFIALFTHGILERHPRLKFVLGESGTGWVPFVVQEMEYRWKLAIERKGRDGVTLKTPPSELFKRQVWATYQQDRVGLSLVHFFGEGKMMWASDYPHPDSTWPNSRAIVEKETAHLTHEARRAILHDNARALYGL